MRLEITASVSIAFLLAFADPGKSFAADALPQPDPQFSGKIGATTAVSTPDWPKLLQAPKGAPNVLLILLDDVGFADASTFGGAIATPEMDKLAAQGLRYNNLNTAAMCSPTRAALLSGRNHHRVGFGRIADMAGGYPGYDSVWKRDTASVARVLHDSGYSTAAIGKWHNTPEWEITPVGPFDRWPTGLGFDYFYGFMGPGFENQWNPRKLYRNTLPVDPPATPEQGYHLTTDFVDEAARWIRTHDGLAPGQPWFLYFAAGATHAPHHAPKEWIDRYKGRFDRGWDALRAEIFARQKKLGIIPPDAKLNPRPPELPAWDSLSLDQRRLLARQMEVYAGFLAHTDHEIGRLIQAARQGPNGHNTLIIYIAGDNGPDGMNGIEGLDFPGDLKTRLAHIDELGGPSIPINAYSFGWAWAGVTPFQGTKAVASHMGGLRNPMIVSWPEGIREPGGLRTQFTHVNDVAATIYEAAHIDPPKTVDGIAQAPLDGVSFLYSFNEAKAASKHRVQYFEIWSNRAIYQDGWLASARHTSFDSFKAGVGNKDAGSDTWELYDLNTDFSQSRDLAARHPARLAALRELFDSEARKNHVYPLGGSRETRRNALPFLIERGAKLTLYPDMDRTLPLSVMLNDKSYRIEAYIDIQREPADGQLFAISTSGYSPVGSVSHVVSVKNNAVVFDYGGTDGVQHQLTSPELTPGPNIVSIVFTKANGPGASNGTSPGIGRLYVNGADVGEAAFATPRWGNVMIDKDVSRAMLEKITLEVK